MTSAKYTALFSVLMLSSLGGGYLAALQPSGTGWRFFSWHPFLMSVGMIGFGGIGAITKKLGGYKNTKVRNAVLLFNAYFCFYVS